MSDSSSFRCVLIGADSLLIECGEIALKRGHTIVAVAAGSARVAAWARKHSLRVVDASPGKKAWAQELASEPFDWLFAITHLAILPDEVLKLPTAGAINFHDGPLPHYAGLNTPAWALMKGEPKYGISWHAITAGIDEGDLYKQREFEIAPNETSLSLNTRNFGVAIESFAELIDEIAQGRATKTPQGTSDNRQTFSRHDRPPALCVLDWTRPAVDLERMVRALDFGRYLNPLGSAKLWHAGQAFIVRNVEVRDDVEEGAPGTLVSVDDTELVVRCSEGALALRGFASLGGADVTAGHVTSTLGLAQGTVLDVLDDDKRAKLTALGTVLAKSERAFNTQLSALEPVELPVTTPANAAGTTPSAPRFATLDLDVPAAFDDKFGAEHRVPALVAAFAATLARVSGKDRFHLGLVDADALNDTEVAGSLVARRVPLDVALDTAATFDVARASIATELGRAKQRKTFLRDLVSRVPELMTQPSLAAGALVPVGVRIGSVPSTSPNAADSSVAAHALDDSALELVIDGSAIPSIRYDESRVSATDAKAVAGWLSAVIDAVSRAGAANTLPLSRVDLLGDALKKRVLEQWNATGTDYRRDACVHQLIEEQADKTPDATALIFEDEKLSYRELEARGNRLAAHLKTLGIGPDKLVGVFVERGIDLVVAVLGVHKAGGAYVPLDPTYPRDRIEHMITDSGCAVIVTQDRLVAELPVGGSSAAAGEVGAPSTSPTLVKLDGDSGVLAKYSAERVKAPVKPTHLAYCIYTSGSTGKPKGVLIEHRNVVNFFAGMDSRVAHDGNGNVWFAVTSLSFDISVLELLYTLARGFSVVVYLDRERTDALKAVNAGDKEQFVEKNAAQPIDFSLFYFSGDEAENAGAGKYRLLLEGAKWADEHGFVAVWTPERHFHAFGGLYPNPAVTGAAVAAVTKRVAIRAGSVVMPLHHPIRVAEAWSIVDNISNGRVGISIASGWHPNDFVLMPENYKDAKNIMFRDADILQRLWRGEKVSFAGATGTPVEVETLPRPVQKELPMWVTTAGNPETFAQAGKLGKNVLTHLLGQSVEQLKPKLDAYRKARADAGFDPDAGVVSLMLHTFVGDDEDKVREIVREPLKQYLGTSLSLLKQYAWAFPAFKNATAGDSKGDEFSKLTPEENDAVLEFAFLRYYETSGLFGTPESVRQMVDTLKGIGVNEIACLLDFGVATDTVLGMLPHLDEVRRNSNASVHAGAPKSSSLDQSAAAQLKRHSVTHMQCTPSMARMLSLHDESRAALSDVKHLFVGGEAFPVQLARELKNVVKSGSVTNMYGPTETTVWSTTWKLEGELDTIPIGTPIANTQIYILDKNLQPLPPGVPGELWIGGDGVVRGYHNRPELTAERFVADPFRNASMSTSTTASFGTARMYRTGDLAKWRTLPDGTGIIDFLGRVDHQVKIRGYRIELGEIEAQLGRHAQVREMVVVVADEQLVAYVAPKDGPGTAASRVDIASVKDQLRRNLPEFMVPAHIAVLDDLPRTPNGKIDRKALPSLAQVRGASATGAAVEVVPAANDQEREVLTVWKEILGRDGIGVDDNFFDSGGDSLLVVRMHRRLKEVIEKPVSLTDLYRFPTVRSFVEFLSSDGASAAMKQSQDRAARRRENMARRRAR